LRLQPNSGFFPIVPRCRRWRNRAPDLIAKLRMQVLLLQALSQPMQGMD